jgi:choice-of-anchor B domain-containing protein
MSGKPRIRGVVLAAAAALATAVAPAEAQPGYNMTLLSNLDVHSGVNDCWGYTAPDGTELAMYGYSTGTAFVDATDPLNPFVVLDLPGPTSGWRDIKTYQHYAYVVTEGNGAGTGLQIVDLDDPSAPVHLDTYTAAGFTSAHNIWIDTGAGVAYACGAQGGMHILSLADPENPVEIDFFTPFYVHDLYVADGRAYCGAINIGALAILDVTNPANPATLATHFYANASTHNSWPTLDESHCVTSDEGGSNRLKVWDITNLSNIRQVSEYVPSTEPAVVHNALLRDDLAFMSHYKAGVRAVDLTDPAAPVEVGYYDTFPTTGTAFEGCWGVYPFRDDDVIYASDRATGLYILRFDGDYAGDVSGRVTDATGGQGIAVAEVELVGAPSTLFADSAGDYATTISGGTYTVITSAFGYEPDTAQVIVPPQGAVVHDVALTRLPSGTVELHLAEAGTGTPVADARLDIVGTPLAGMVSDASGVVSVVLPAGASWSARVAKFGRALTVRSVQTTTGALTPVTVEMVPGFDDDFDLDQAWLTGEPGDDATGGIWERAVPVGSAFGGPVGADQDATPTGDGYAYVTENHVSGAFVGSSDVDGGRTTLLSPVFDASGLGSLTLEYQRWFSNRAPSPDADEFRADVSTDGGSSWTNLETLAVGTDAWALVSLDLTSVVPATSAMQIRFVAEDAGAGTYVEAGIDDVRILTAATAAEPAAGGLGETGLRLAAPAPNPSRDATEIAFRLPESGAASLEIFDVTGRRVAVLLAGERVASGSHTVRWSGRDDRGARVAAGVYFARLSAGGEVRSRKVVRRD